MEVGWGVQKYCLDIVTNGRRISRKGQLASRPQFCGQIQGTMRRRKCGRDDNAVGSQCGSANQTQMRGHPQVRGGGLSTTNRGACHVRGRLPSMESRLLEVKPQLQSMRLPSRFEYQTLLNDNGRSRKGSLSLISLGPPKEVALPETPAKPIATQSEQ